MPTIGLGEQEKKPWKHMREPAIKFLFKCIVQVQADVIY
jgi:hypothetical protein